MRDRRSEIRFGADQPAVVSVLSDGPPQQIPATVVEASKSGLRIMLDVPLPNGTTIKVEWDSTALVCETRHCRQRGPNRYSVGLKITEVLGRGKLKTQPGAA
jgi:PilZ domain-containing protein